MRTRADDFYLYLYPYRTSRIAAVGVNSPEPANRLYVGLDVESWLRLGLGSAASSVP